jgi:hypothetical protein
MSVWDLKLFMWIPDDKNAIFGQIMCIYLLTIKVNTVTEYLYEI